MSSSNQTHDLPQALNDIGLEICKHKTITRVLTNPLFNALVITVISMLLVLLVVDHSTPKIWKYGVYMLISVVAMQLMYMSVLNVRLRCSQVEQFDHFDDMAGETVEPRAYMGGIPSIPTSTSVYGGDRPPRPDYGADIASQAGDKW